MMPTQRKHVGKKFFMLTIIDQIPGKKCICECQCGNKKTFLTANVIRGDAKSCGCIDSIHRKNYDEDALKKLLLSIEKNQNGCWIWQKSRHRQGYGHFPYKMKLQLAHRISWLLHNGPIPEGLCVLHKCDNPPCCNPEHLFLGTYQTNIKDCVKKGRYKKYQGKRFWKARLCSSKVKEIRSLHEKNFSFTDITKKFGISEYQAKRIVERKTYKNI